MSHDPKWVFKTNQVLSNESATIMPIILKEYDKQLREQIAKKIESDMGIPVVDQWFHEHCGCDLKELVYPLITDIVRGQK